MELIKFNCEKCGSELDKPKDDLTPYICKYCGFSNTLGEDYKVNYIKTHGVQPVQKMINDKLKRAEKLLFDEENFKEAYEVYSELFEYIPSDMRVLEGLMVSYSKNFTGKLDDDEINTEFASNFEFYYLSYMRHENDIQKMKRYKNQYNKFYVNYLLYRKVSSMIIIFAALVLIIVAIYYFYLLSL